MSEIWDVDWRRRALDVRFIRNDVCYSFLVELEGRDKIDNLPYTRMLQVSMIEEVQRRACYRLKYSFDIYVRPAGSGERFEKCRGFDLSEKGAGINTKKSWHKGDRLECKFKAGKTEYFFDATVMRRLVWMKDERYEYKLGIQFEFTDDIENKKQQKALRKFIFKEQVARKL